MKDGFAKSVLIDEELDSADQYDSKTSMSTTNVTDWDGDGDLDLIIGSTAGTVSVNLNQGNKTSFKFGKRQPVQGVDGKPLRVCQKSDPLPVDWDGDGVLDLLVGDYSSVRRLRPDIGGAQKQALGEIMAEEAALGAQPDRTALAALTKRKHEHYADEGLQSCVWLFRRR